jgi:hypothetical protein
MTKQFDLAEFEAFCRSKPAGERYCFLDAQKCPATQFGRHIGVISGRQTVYEHQELARLHHGVCEQLCESPATFSALADRLSRVDS